MTDFDTREFRTALSGFSTGVTIVTSISDDGEKVGMTASSFNSVSTEPPLILWSVTKSALSASVFAMQNIFRYMFSRQTKLIFQINSPTRS